MKYIGIVNKIKDEHPSGFYGRLTVSDDEAKEILEDVSSSFGWDDALQVGLTIASVVPVVGPIARIASIAGAAAIGVNKKSSVSFKNFFKTRTKNEVTLQREIKNTDKKILIFDSDSFDNDFKINERLLYGLFDNLSHKLTRKKILSKLFKSKGGSQLDIIERNSLPSNFRHLNNGHFSEGIYIFHPKNENILIPLENSNSLIQSLILEETIRAFEALGAKKIVISDITEIKSKTKVKVKDQATAGANVGYNKDILREKRFGKGVFSPKRAMENKYFIQDIPSVMTTIEARKSGNQLEEKFAETVLLNVGMDIDVLNTFNAQSNFSYLRKWFFHVEFYDKNTIDIID